VKTRVHCGPLTLPVGLPLTQRLTRVATAAQLLSSAAALEESGLAAPGCARVPEGCSAEPVLERAAAAGMVSLNAQADGYWRDDS